jgi:predicted methyltransferase
MRVRDRFSLVLAFFAILALPTPFAPSRGLAAEPEIPPAIAAAVAAPDRSEADQALDAGRHPAEMLAFFGIAPGMKVAEIGAAGGYTAELLARIVGPEGRVYGQNAPFVLQRFAEKPWSERLQKPVMKNVVRLDRPFDDPLPPDVQGLDAVLIVLFYHDTYWQGVDRARMNAAVYRALKPGGVYAIVDHSARPGTGAADVQTLHRIEERTLVEDVEKAGFERKRSADFLRNPKDTRDWNASPVAAGEKRGESDRFVLEFVKPAS